MNMTLEATEPATVECNLCREIVGDLTAHLESEHSRELTLCELCNDAFLSDDYTRHMIEAHGWD